MKYLEDFKDIHKDQRAFIVCNGPSLNDIDVSKLKGKITFGLNRGYLKTDLDIKYLVVIAIPVMEQWGDEILNVRCDTLFCNRLDANHVCKMKFGGVGRIFQKDLTKPMYRGNTVTYVAMQLAYWMGCNPVYCVGLDHGFVYDNTKNTNEGRKLINVGEDLNHFDPNYFGIGAKWLPYEPHAVERAFSLARDAYFNSGREIYNCSTRTNLSEKILPRKDFNSICE